MRSHAAIHRGAGRQRHHADGGIAHGRHVAVGGVTAARHRCAAAELDARALERGDPVGAVARAVQHVVGQGHLAAQPVAPVELGEFGQAAVVVAHAARQVDQRPVAVVAHLVQAQALRQLVGRDGVALRVAQPHVLGGLHALPEGGAVGRVGEIAADAHPHGQVGAAVGQLPQGGEGVVAVGQVQLAFGANHHRLQPCGSDGAGFGHGAGKAGARHQRNLTRHIARVVDGAAAVVGTVIVRTLAFGAVKVARVIVGGIVTQVASLRGGKAREIRLLATQVVVDLVVPHRRLGGQQLAQAHLQHVAHLRLQVLAAGRHAHHAALPGLQGLPAGAALRSVTKGADEVAAARGIGQIDAGQANGAARGVGHRHVDGGRATERQARRAGLAQRQRAVDGLRHYRFATGQSTRSQHHGPQQPRPQRRRPAQPPGFPYQHGDRHHQQQQTRHTQ